MSTDVRSFSRAIMAEIPDVVQQHIEQLAKCVAEASRSLWLTASAHPFESVIAVATAGIFIFAWVVARSTRKLWLATKEASATQSRDIQASIAVAQEAANAAAKSAATSARAVVDMQRALIVPTQFQSTAIVRNDRVIAYRITAVFENTGTTVARRFTDTANIVMWKGPLPEDFKYPDRMEAIAPNAFVAPRLKIPFPVDIAIQDLLDIMNKKMRGFIYGWVEYDDVFTIVLVRRMVGARTAPVRGSQLTARDRKSARLPAPCACPVPARPSPRQGLVAAARRRPRAAARCSHYLQLALGSG
jgi:hypothetical protein